ncbi:alpha-hydroxy-acid oxidizing protein [Convivina praedatoris]|uniref:L-lactate oxidase n=1 Tax=Convivina praedatoris TaxID=2880963 RepID=A0ABM9CZI2_9LACO|nr:alpha-hydroxy-acid oxidizing protein [Convivina sp. LMG 32447]CAH1849883.1 4-hydroxymandelate oxidase [Convivina sp. LMG 32447]CAH1849887.1 4-hydroxymandelate oxidase [Convivina sp. LMG 32447]CAH1851353.1 4-hydroxymandelate oxidase [Convivina sp. LMG 32447]
MVSEFKTSQAEGFIPDFVNTYDLEGRAQKVIPADAFGYISSGAGDEFTLTENDRAFNHKLIIPQVLADVENPDTATTVDGHTITAPIILAPVAAHKLANDAGEIASAQGVHNFNTVYTTSSYSSVDLPDITEALAGSPEWFQFYFSKDNEINKHIIDRVKALGVKKIVLTADATVGGNREVDVRNHFVFPVNMPIVQEYLPEGVGRSMNYVYGSAKQKLSATDVEFIAAYSGLPVYVKGVQSAKDVERSLDAGASGIWVSNHGGRQLDGGPAAFDSLQYVAKAVNHRVPIVYDSGIRRGQHIFKALASGADLVAIGRPAIYGLALGGSRGVEQVFDKLTEELKMVMQLAGTQTIEDVKHYQLRDNDFV